MKAAYIGVIVNCTLLDKFTFYFIKHIYLLRDGEKLDIRTESVLLSSILFKMIPNNLARLFNLRTCFCRPKMLRGKRLILSKIRPIWCI
jgi:hypothetical protein